MAKILSCKSGILLAKNDSGRLLIPIIKVTSQLISGAHSVILVYDITNLETFESIENFWLNEV